MLRSGFRSGLSPTFFKIFQQHSVHGFGLLNHEDCRFEVSRLEAAEFPKRTVEGALGGAAGAVDRDLEPVEFFVGQIVWRRNFETGAAAEAPCGVNDFAGEGLLERRAGREFEPVASLEFIKDVALFGTDEVGDGE